jgi:hypothetical protein
MRKMEWLGSVFLAVALVQPLWAQRSSGFQSIDPRDITFKPIDTTANLAAPLPQQQPKGFSLLNFMPKLSLPSFLSRSKPAVSSFPQPTLPSVQTNSLPTQQVPHIHRFRSRDQ